MNSLLRMDVPTGTKFSYTYFDRTVNVAIMAAELAAALDDEAASRIDCSFLGARSRHVRDPDGDLRIAHYLVFPARQFRSTIQIPKTMSSRKTSHLVLTTRRHRRDNPDGLAMAEISLP
jgi:hypothetical protein